MITEGSAPLEDNRLNIPNCARTPVLGVHRRESPLLLRLDVPESRQITVPGTPTPKMKVIIAP
eukprot:5007720-Pyramimonas_sp.AAC.1